MSDRRQILSALRRHTKPGPPPTEPGPRPAPPADIEAEFLRRAQANTTLVQWLDTLEELPLRVAQYAVDNSLPAQLVATHPLAAELAWQDAGLELLQRTVTDGDKLALSWAECGIAETGTVLVQSGPNNSATLNFLPDHHMVVLKRSALVAQWEDCWDYCRRHWPEGAPPRALNFISGPSCTADVGLTQVYGAHGPRNFTVFITRS